MVRKTVVLNGGAAQKLVVLARSSGEQSDENGLSLFLVDAWAEGVTTTAYRMTDGREAANITLDNVTAEAVIGGLGEGYALMSPWWTRPCSPLPPTPWEPWNRSMPRLWNT